MNEHMEFLNEMASVRRLFGDGEGWGVKFRAAAAEMERLVEVEREAQEVEERWRDTMETLNAEIASLKARRARPCDCCVDDHWRTLPFSEVSDCPVCHGTGAVMEEGS